MSGDAFTFNATFDPQEKRWKAGQFGNIKADAPFYEAARRAPSRIHCDRHRAPARKIWNASIDKHPGIIARQQGIREIIDSGKLLRKNWGD